VISTSFNRDVITQLPHGSAAEVPGLSEGLKAVKAGERRKITVKADEAYGLYDPTLARQASRRSLAGTEALEVGSHVHLANSFGDFRLYRVTKILGDLIYLDANHPLAGQDLVFDVHVVDARDATEKEILESNEPGPKRYLH
jgi:FKBP-type peptidyl-prolyl cis-trans isomerase SlyD